MNTWDDSPSAKFYIQRIDAGRKLQNQIPQEEYFKSGKWKQAVTILLMSEIGKAMLFLGSDGFSGTYKVDVEKDRLTTLGITEKTVGKYLRAAAEELKDLVGEFEFAFKKLEVVPCDGVKEDPDSYCCVTWELMFDEE